MKLLILFALLGLSAAQYVYNAHPFAYNHPYTYATHPYNVHPYAGYNPFVYTGLPYAFQPAKPVEEEKPAEEPVVEATRKKRDVGDATPEKGSVAYHVTPYAFPYSPYTHPVYNTAAYNTAAYTSYSHPLVYSSYYHPYAGLHSIKKRDTAAAEDQKADDALVYTTYAARPYTFPYTYNYRPAVYNAAHSVYSGAYPVNYHYPYYSGVRYAY